MLFVIDLVTIRETLLDYGYDVDAAIEFLILTQDIYKQPQSVPVPNKSSITIGDYFVDDNFDAEEYIPPTEDNEHIQSSPIVNESVTEVEKPKFCEEEKLITPTETTPESIPESTPEPTEKKENISEKSNKKDQDHIVAESDKKPKPKEKIIINNKKLSNKERQIQTRIEKKQKQNAKQEARKERKRTPKQPGDDDIDLDLGALSI